MQLLAETVWVTHFCLTKSVGPASWKVRFAQSLKKIFLWVLNYAFSNFTSNILKSTMWTTSGKNLNLNTDKLWYLWTANEYSIFLSNFSKHSSRCSARGKKRFFSTPNKNNRRTWVGKHSHWELISSSSYYCWGKIISAYYNFQLLWYLTPSLPRVIKFKFLLHSHQQYYITQYEELGFS